MNYAVVFIVMATFALVVFEVRVIRKDRLTQAKQAAFPEFEDTYISALQSGISISDAFSFANDFELPQMGKPLNKLVAGLDRGLPLLRGLEEFRESVALSQADLFVAIVALAHQTGGQNLVSSLSQHVNAIRQELAAQGDVRARQSAILSVAKLGLLAPWVLVGVISVNEQTRFAFNSFGGNILLTSGFGVSILAYRLIVASGKLPGFARFLGAVSA